jgi:phosphoglycolate phosphatase-like HAD superfamily hydrolase
MQSNAGDDRLAIFDIDGTLTDSVALHQASLLETLSSYGFPRLNTDWGSYEHHTDSAMFADAWREGTGSAHRQSDWLSFVKQHEETFHRLATEAAIGEVAGAAEFVRLLRDTGWHVVFATGSIRKLAIMKLDAVGIPCAPDALATATEFLTREDLVRQAIRLAGEPPRSGRWRAVSIGDGNWDLRTAQRLSLPFVGVGPGFNGAADEFPVVRDYTHPEAVLALLEQAVHPSTLHKHIQVQR